MKKIKDVSRELKKILPKAKITEDADMALYTTFKAGGKAALLVEVNTVEELRSALQIIDENQIPTMFLGNGSNTLFKDEGYEGVVVKLSNEKEGFGNMVFKEEADNKVRVVIGAGSLMSTCAKAIQKQGLTGFEAISGIPGSLGGAVFMNAGAYDGEMSQVVDKIRAVSADGKETGEISAEEMEFSYRHSLLQDGKWICYEVELLLKKGNREEIDEKMREYAFKRNSKQPLNYPSAGSTFKRPEGYFAGKLIEDSGLKGVSVGGAMVSTLHSGFVINTGNATATDIIHLIHLIQNTVYDNFGVKLEREVRIIG